jgi:LuxR family transcriptional regulator, maltose regulon positive regulatory protein
LLNLVVQTSLVDGGSTSASLAAAQRILANFTAEAPSPSQKSPDSNGHAALPEPLSEREIEILRLIESGLSNEEIARRLVVTVGTVKTHLRNAYGKLDVHSRTQAVAKARTLQVI